MEVARNPSDENIKNWITYLDKKNYLAERLRARVADFTMKGAAPQALVQETLAKIPPAGTKFDPAQFRVRTYFDSHCPHCRRMLGTLRELQDLGVYVEALQIDRERVDSAQFAIATERANPADVKKQGIESVPFTLIANIKSKTVLKPITGFKSVDEMRSILSAMSNH